MLHSPTFRSQQGVSLRLYTVVSHSHYGSHLRGKNMTEVKCSRPNWEFKPARLRPVVDVLCSTYRLARGPAMRTTPFA